MPRRRAAGHALPAVPNAAGRSPHLVTTMPGRVLPVPPPGQRHPVRGAPPPRRAPDWRDHNGRPPGSTGTSDGRRAAGHRRATEGGRGLGHHRRVGARHAGTATVAGGRGPRRALGHPRAGRRGCAPPGRGAGRRPMPWVDANGLLPGRGAPGRPGPPGVPPDADRGCRTRGRGRLLVSRGRGLGGRGLGAGATAAGSRLRPRAPLGGRRGPGRGPGGGRGPGSLGGRRGPASGRGCRRCRRLGGAAAGASGAWAASVAVAAGAFGQAWRAPSWPPSSPPPAHPGAQLGPVLVGEPLDDGGFEADEAALTNSPISFSFVRTTLLSTPYFLASSTDSDLGHAFSSWSEPLAEGGCGPLAGLHAHREVLIAGS